MISSRATTEYFSKVLLYFFVNVLVAPFDTACSQECACSWTTARSSDNSARSRDGRARFVPIIARREIDR